MIHAHDNYKGIDAVKDENGEFLYPKGYAEKKTKVKSWQDCGRLCFFRHHDKKTAEDLCGTYTYDKLNKICYLMRSGSAVGEEVKGILWCPSKKYMTGY